MALSEAEKKKIEEEERFRAETRKTLKKKPWFVPQGIGAWLITIFIIFPFAVGLFISFLGDSSKAPAEQNTSSQLQSNEPEVTQVKSGKFLDYTYEIGKDEKTNQYVVIFNPFLPRTDGIVTSVMLEMVTQIYGKHTVVNLEPSIVERDGKNLLVFQGVDGNYYFLLVKGSNNEGVISFVFWKE